LSAFERALKSRFKFAFASPWAGIGAKGAGDLSENLGIHSHVTFVGDVNDVKPYLQAADIFVLPSLGEGFPIVCWRPWRRDLHV